MNPLADPVAVKKSSGDKLRILQIYLIMLIIIDICKFRISCNRQISRNPGSIRHLQIPDFIGPVKRHII